MDHDIFHAGAFPELGVRPGLKILPTALLSHQALELVRCCEAGASTEGGEWTQLVRPVLLRGDFFPPRPVRSHCRLMSPVFCLQH